MTEKGETAAGQWLGAVCFKVYSRAGWLGRGEAAVLCFQAPCSHPLLWNQVILGCRDHLHLSLPLHRSFQTSGFVHLVFSIVQIQSQVPATGYAALFSVSVPREVCEPGQGAQVHVSSTQHDANILHLPGDCLELL